MSDKIIGTDMIKNKIIYNSFSNWAFDVAKAKDSHIWDTSGKKLIDFTSGWNVTNLGWNNAEISVAMISQTKKNTYAPMWTADPIQNDLADLLTNSLPKELNAVGRATGGTEANEEAIKTARAYTGRSKIIGFKDTYHGQSYATLSIGYLPSYIQKMGIGPMVGDFVQIDYPNTYRTEKSESDLLEEFINNLETILRNRDIAAIVTEAGIITGWGSTYVGPTGYLKAVREITKKYGTLIILDEVGTGFSRCGKLFGMELENVVPDIVTFAKGMCNGAVPIGAMITTSEIAEKTAGKTNLTSTFGWTPVSCAAALKTLQIHKRDKVWLKAQRDGQYLITTLRKELKDCRYIGDIRGKGMEIGVDFVKDKKSKEKNSKLIVDVVSNCRKNGLHTVCDLDSNIQIMPPLVIERSILDKGLDIFLDTVKSLA